VAGAAGANGGLPNGYCRGAVVHMTTSSLPFGTTLYALVGQMGGYMANGPYGGAGAGGGGGTFVILGNGVPLIVAGGGGGEAWGYAGASNCDASFSTVGNPSSDGTPGGTNGAGGSTRYNGAGLLGDGGAADCSNSKAAIHGGAGLQCPSYPSLFGGYGGGNFGGGGGGYSGGGGWGGSAGRLAGGGGSYCSYGCISSSNTYNSGHGYLTISYIGP
jgi:hypothetical protein